MILSALLSDSNEYLILVLFLLFEMTCGMFWPTYGTLRSIHIPESQRATISTVFRIPLNLFVIVLLLQTDRLSNALMFVICGAAHFISLICFAAFYYMNKKSKSTEGTSVIASPAVAVAKKARLKKILNNRTGVI
eukprot:UN03601